MSRNWIIFGLFIIITSCVSDGALEIESPNTDVVLEITEYFVTEVSEPSGLCYDPLSGNLLTLSDKPTNKIYRIDQEGHILTEFDFEGNDLEGITFRTTDNTIWIVDELLFEVICLDYTGNLIDRYSIDVPYTNQNNGLEGISYNPRNGNFYLLNEANPGLLIEWHPIQGIINQTELNFADDYSGITYDYDLDGFWIVSDESMTLHFCNNLGESLQKYNTDISSIEGLIPTNEENEFIGVCDSENKIYKFTVSQQ